MRILNRDGSGVDQRILEDPRFSQSQVDALARVAKVDPEATVTGLDAKMRPVVSAKLPTGQAMYALLRNGDPANPAMPLAESWRSRRSKATR